MSDVCYPTRAKTSPFSVILYILLLVTLPSHLNSLARVSVTLHSFSNPDNKLIDGSYCNADQSFCSTKLDLRFKKPFKLSFVTSQEKTNVISFKIGESAIETDPLGYVTNPFPSNTTIAEPIERLSLMIRAYHFGATREKVASFVLDDPIKFGVQNYGLVSGYSTFNLTTNVTCYDDYYGDCTVHCVGTSQYSCNDTDGSKICAMGWTGINCDTVLAIPCQPNTSSSHSTFQPAGDSFTAGDHVTVSCDPGYRPELSTNLTCLSNGVWSPPWPYCHEIKCGRLSTFPGGVISPDTVTRITSSIGTVANLSCLPGYTLNGTASLQCLSNGTWDRTLPTCDVNLCPPIKGPDNGFGVYSANPPMRYPGNVFKQSCYNTRDYLDSGPSERLCRNNGSWTGSVMTCLCRCAKLPVPSDGSVVYSSDPPATGTTATFTCHSGTQLVGQSSALCTESGVWNVSVSPSCATGCNWKDLKISNSTISPPTYKTDSLTVGYSVTFSCPGPQPYFLSGPALATCLDSGHWDTTVPHCLSPVLDIQDKVNNLLVSGLSVLVGVLLAFLAIILILIYVNRRILASSQRKTDTNSENLSQFSERSIKSNKVLNVSQIDLYPAPRFNDLKTKVDNDIGRQTQSQRRAVRTGFTFGNKTETADFKNRTCVVGISNEAFVEDF